MYGRIIRAGHQLNMPDVTTYQHAMELMNEPPKYLCDDEPTIVAETISQYLGPRLPGGPRALACAIEYNHVHLLVGPVHERLDRFIGRIKGNTSSVLRTHPNNWNRQRIWATGYWKVFLFDDDAVRIVQEYIHAHNIRRGMTASPYEWLRRI
jgi:hypothetical protein